MATVEGAEALIGAAVERFGRLDVLVNNAGIIRWAGLPEVDADNLARHLAVHLGGSFNTARAAWPHMVEPAYGRIVMTTSTGMFGLPDNTSYATAKAAVIGLARSLATAGRRPRHPGQLHRPGGLHPHGRWAEDGDAMDPAPCRWRPSWWPRWSASSPTSPAR